MKIRNGFVSNSSSSSFILLINNKTEEVLIEELHKELFYFLTVDRLVEKFQDEIKELEERLKNTSDEFFKTAHKSRIELLKSYIEKVLSLRDEGFSELLKWYLANIKGITIKELRNVVFISGSCGMYNDAGDTPDLLKNILCYYMITQPNNVIGLEMKYD